MSFDVAVLNPLALALGLCGACLAAAVSSSTDSAAIVNSGSTNSAGFTIVVERSGDSEYRVAPRGFNAVRPIRRKLPAALVQRFYSDLEAAQPLSALPGEHCLKSKSFGSTTIIQLGSEKTPDLSCPNAPNVHIQALLRDSNEIVNLFRTD